MSRKIAIVAALGAAALLPAPVLADGFNAGTETVSAGAVTATLSWSAGDLGPQNTRLTVTRGGTVAFDRTIARVCGQECNRSTGDGRAFELADLDGDGEPEVVLTAQNDARCCTTMGIYGFDAAAGTYGELVHEWGLAGVELRKVGAVTAIVSTDERFRNLVPGHTSLFFPPIVYGYKRTGTAAKLVDRTRSSRSVIRAAAADLRGLIRDNPDADVFAKVYVGSYVAEEYLLGHGSVGLKELDRQAKRGVLGKPASVRKFRKRLLTLLDRYGYR